MGGGVSNIRAPVSLDGDGAYRHIGMQLRAARESKGIELEAVARCLKVHYEVLQAIEAGSFQDLYQSPIYWCAHVRSYCRLIDLDETEVLGHLSSAVSEQNGSLVFPSPLPPIKRRKGLVLWCSILGAVLVVSFVVTQRHRQVSVINRSGQSEGISVSPPLPAIEIQESSCMQGGGIENE